MAATSKRIGIVIVALVLMTSGFLGAQWLFPIYASQGSADFIANATAISTSGGLQTTINSLSHQYTHDVSADATDVHAGATSHYIHDTQTLADAMYKLYVTYAVYTLAGDGQLSLSSTFAGMTYSLDEYLDLMQSISDKERDTIRGETDEHAEREYTVVRV